MKVRTVLLELMGICISTLLAGSQTAPSVTQSATKSSNCVNILALARSNVECSSLTARQAKIIDAIPALLKKILADQIDPARLAELIDRNSQSLTLINNQGNIGTSIISGNTIAQTQTGGSSGRALVGVVPGSSADVAIYGSCIVSGDIWNYFLTCLDKVSGNEQRIRWLLMDLDKTWSQRVAQGNIDIVRVRKMTLDHVADEHSTVQQLRDNPPQFSKLLPQ